MATGGAPRRDGPVALSALFDDALRELVPPAPPTPPAPRGAAAASLAAPVSDGFLYSGNRHESVPRALFLDRRLTPLERNAWQVFRLQLQSDGVTAFPTYDQLRPYLASMPCAAQASHETVARALTLLRLTRWLSLVRRRRDPKTGRILGNLYVLHDEPLTPFEAMQLDPDYLGLVSQALTHAAKAVQIVGMNTLREIAEDPMLNGRTLPTRLQVLAQRMARNKWADASYPQAPVDHESEEGQDGLLRNLDGPSSESEGGPYCTYGSYKSSTYSTAREGVAAPAPARAPAALEGRAAKRRDGGLAAGGRVAAAGGAGRMGCTLPQQRGAQPGRLPVRHRPEGDPRRVQGLGRRSWFGIDAACAVIAATSCRTGALCTATACAERPRSRGGAGLPGEAAFDAWRFLSSYPQGIAGTRSLPAIGFGAVMRHIVAARCGPIPRG